jgi:hypothetical protein
MLASFLNYSGYPRLRSWRQSYALVVLGTFAVVLAADRLLYDSRSLGWTSALVAAAMLAVLAVRDTRFLDMRGGRVAWLATVGLILALIEQPTWLNVLYILIGFATLALINGHGWDNDFTRWLGRFGHWLAVGWTRLFRDNGLAMRWLVRRGFSPTLARGLAAWLVPALLASVFIAIFAWANPIISGWFDQLGTFITHAFERLPDYLNPARVIFWLFFAAIAWSLLRSRTHGARRRRRRANVVVGTTRTTTSPPPAAQIDPQSSDEWILPTPPVSATGVKRQDDAGFPASMVIRCLILFNLVFAVELTLDLFMLLSQQFGGDGTAFKQYVRRGAYPLVAAALLAGAFVLITFRPRSETERSAWARKLVYFWIGQTILLTISAMWRLVRYVDLTELTRLRVASTIWFILVCCGLFYIVWRIVRGRSNAWLININAVTALLILYPCCFINFDGMIANFNARHCEEVGGGGSSLDIAYFEALGTPALPALDSVRDRLHGDARQAWAKDVSDRLHAELDADVNDWRAWTWRRSRSARAVREVQLAKAHDREQQQRQLAQAALAPASPQLRGLPPTPGQSAARNERSAAPDSAPSP